MKGLRSTKKREIEELEIVGRGVMFAERLQRYFWFHVGNYMSFLKDSALDMRLKKVDAQNSLFG